ncbi:MAG: Dabb family protein [Polyangiales bacterium]
MAALFSVVPDARLTHHAYVTIRHILLMRPRAETTAEQIEAARRAITNLVGKIPGLRDCYWGENGGPRERIDGLTHAFSMDFEDKAALDAYGPHPDHTAAAALVRAAFDRIVVLDLPL